MKFRETLSKCLLSILLVSLLSSIASGNTMMMINPAGQPVIQMAETQPVFQFQLPSLPPLIGIQSAYADKSITFNDNLVNDCEESGDGVNNEDCDITPIQAIDLGTQVPPTGTSNLYDVIVNIDALNDCDEFNAGDNNADCISTPTHIVGPVTQTNDPSVNPVGTNEIDIVTDDHMLNGCDEAGNGDNNAVCNNIGSNTITSITQFNEVDGTNVGVNFVESNTVNTLQGFDLNNDCDEEGDGNTAASCDNDVDNLIGPVDQSNNVTNT